VTLMLVATYPRFMLDIETLRIAQGVVAVTAFALIYLGSYRSTRSPYAAWWAFVVAASGLGSVLYLLAFTSLKTFAAPAGNALGLVAGVGIVASARSLRGARTPWWFFAGAAAVGAVATLIENPQGGAYPGGASTPIAYAAVMAYATHQYWNLVGHGGDRRKLILGPDATAAIVAMSIAITIVFGFYFVRSVAFFAVGPDSELYGNFLGPAATALAGCAGIVVVTYSVAHLSRYEVTQGWKLRATHDDLTGLLARDAFREKAERELARNLGVGTAMMLADFDHFKRLNDQHGHARGDRALLAFGEACRTHLGPGDLAGRWGGEEFIVLLAAGGTERAKTVASALSDSVARVGRRGEAPLTLSYGIVDGSSSVSFDVLVSRADDALYRAKDAGRDRSIVYRQAREP
jgi:diguanylate cyclase (GGDEF)-like protein